MYRSIVGLHLVQIYSKIRQLNYKEKANKGLKEAKKLIGPIYMYGLYVRSHKFTLKKIAVGNSQNFQQKSMHDLLGCNFP